MAIGTKASKNERTDAAAARRATRWLLGAAALGAVALIALLGIGARRWVGQPFPGFFLLPNGVIASVGLPGWSGNLEGVIYQHTLVAVNGHRVADTAAAYDLVQRQPAGTPLTYTLRTGTATAIVTIPSMTFSVTDYWAIFGGYLASGLTYVLLGLLGAWVLGEAPIGRAVLLLGGTAGLYTLSGLDLYGPAGSLRLNALLETLLPAALVHTALVLRPRRAAAAPFTAAAWWLALALAIPTQFLLGQPGMYTTLHAAAEGCVGAAGLALLACLIVERGRTGHARWLPPATAGALLGIGMPAVEMTLSSLSGSRLPINICTATMFLFPLCFCYGLVRHRLGALGRAPDATPA